MSSYPKGPWDQKWKFASPLGKGGQGETFLVNSTDGCCAVLKVLLKHKDPERRKRMYLETANLKVLDHPGIPRLVDTNAQEYEDLDTKLYAVIQLVPGPTLEQRVSDNGA